MRVSQRRQILLSRPSSLRQAPSIPNNLPIPKPSIVEEISALRQELVAARREMNSLRAINECYARKLKTYDGIAQLIAAAARTEPVP